MTTAHDILSVTATLAYTQAADPKAKDGMGFNNADFPMGLSIAAAGDVEAAAALLRCYPKQVKGHGIEPEDLIPFMSKVETDGDGKVHARSVLASKRGALAGKIAFTQISDSEVLFNGIRLESTVISSLKRLGAKRTTTGYVLSANRVEALVSLVGSETILNAPKLDEIISKHEQVGIPTTTSSKVEFTIKVIPYGSSFFLNWPYSTSALFNTLKDIIKPMSGGFTSGMGWAVTPQQLNMVASTLVEENLAGVDITALIPYSHCTDEKTLDLRDEIRNNVLKVKVLKHDTNEVTLVIRKYDATFVEACKSVRGRYNDANKSWTISRSSVGQVAAALMDHNRFDLSALDTLIEEAVKAQQATPSTLTVSDTTPTGCKLFPHQVGDVEFLTQNFTGTKGALLASDMGLGKTLSVITAANLKAPEGKKLVVVPAVAKENWKREIHRFLGADQKVQILSGRSDKLDPEAKWVILNYDIVSYYKEALVDAKFTYAVLDEVHQVKSLHAQRSKALISYWDQTKKVMVPGITDSIPNVVLMSGTPMLNRPNELFPLLRALGHKLGKSKNEYEKRYCDGKMVRVSRYKEVWDASGSSNSAELAGIMAPFFRKLYKKDVLNLPPKIRTSIPVELSKSERKVFTDLFNSYAEAVATDEEGNATGEILRLINALKMETAKVKVASTIEQVEDIVESGEKCVVFTSYTDILNEIADKFGAQAVRVDGHVTGTKRDAAIDAFQNDDNIRVFVGNTKACGVAITLTAASCVVFNDREWTPGIIEQGEDRCYRIGQTKTVNVYHMTAEGTFDEELVMALDGKSALIQGWESAAIAQGSELSESEAAAPTSIRKALTAYIQTKKAPKKAK